MREIFLLRHFKYVEDGRNPGFLDNPLSEEGKKDGARVARYLKNKQLGEIHSSPVARTMESAQMVADAYNPPLQIKKAKKLRETRSWYQGGELPLREGNRYKTYENIEDFDGETLQDLQDRMVEYLQEAIRYATDHQMSLLLVTHGDPFFALLSKLSDIELVDDHYDRDLLPNYPEKGDLLRLVLNDQGQITKMMAVFFAKNFKKRKHVLRKKAS